jgi:LysM repeat protein
MRRDQPTTPFDVEADELTQQFWGASKGWMPSQQQPQPSARRRAVRPGPAIDDATTAPRTADDTTGSLRVIREGFAAFRPQTSGNITGEVARQRQHGAPRRSASAEQPMSGRRREATLGELAAGRSEVGGWHDDDLLGGEDLLDDHVLTDGGGRRRSRPVVREPEYDVPLTPVHPLVERLGLGAVDPLLVRAGMLALALILLVPVMLSFRPDRDDSLPGEVVEAPQPVVAGAAPATAEVQPPPTATVPAETTAVVPPITQATAAAVEAAASPDAAVLTEQAVAEMAPSPTASPSTTSDPIGDDAAAVDVIAERVVPACPQTYTAAPGDSWYRIADEADVTPSALLAANNATTDTVILAGDDICLPEGASMPSPPATTPATEPATTAPSSEPAPTTTAAPATTAPTTAPTANLSRSEVQELIRQTWPSDEVDTALEIARRESNFIATADNGWCCVGVFQIYWSVHRGWLDDFGIMERSDLFDARKNIAAAFAMWQRSGWGPWGG